LALRPLTTNVDASLALRPLTTNVDVSLALRPLTTNVDASLALRPLTTYVDASLALRAELAGVNTFTAHNKFTGDTSFNSDVFIDGTLTASGDIIPFASAAGNIGSASKPFHSLFISSNSIYFTETEAGANQGKKSILSIDPAEGKIKLRNYAANVDITSVTDDTETTSTGDFLSIVNNKVGVNIDSGNATAHMDISGQLAVSQATTLTSSLFVGGDASLNTRLSVGGDTSFNGDVTIIGNLDVHKIENIRTVNTTTSNYEIIVTNDMSLNGNMSVASNATIVGTLDVTGTINNISSTVFEYLNGVSSNIQTQLDAKQATLTFGKSSGNALKSEETLTTNDILLMGTNDVKGRTYAELKSDLGLNLVENTALSTFTGSSAITTLGTITSLSATNATFTNAPTMSSYSVPASDTTFVTKKYVDDNAGGGGGGAASSVNTTVDASLNGTFTDIGGVIRQWYE